MSSSFNLDEGFAETFIGGFGGGGGGGGGSGAALASINELSSAIAPSAASAPVGGFCGGLSEAVTMGVGAARVVEGRLSRRDVYVERSVWI